MKYLTDEINNGIAYRIGLVGLDLIRYPREKIGDEIDRGLVLRRLLEEAGFLLIEKPKELTEKEISEQLKDNFFDDEYD